MQPLHLFIVVSRNIVQAVLREVTATVRCNGEEKDYNIVIKVLPTGDNGRYSQKNSFDKMLRFSKEVQVYLEIADPINR